MSMVNDLAQRILKLCLPQLTQQRLTRLEQEKVTQAQRGMSTLVTELSEFDRAFYKRAKAAEDELAKIRNDIKFKEKLISSYFDLWLFHDGRDEQEAAKVCWNKKYELEIEVAALYQSQSVALEKVKKYVNS